MQNLEIKKCYEVFCCCFDYIPVCFRVFLEKLNSCRIITITSYERLIAFAAIENNHIAVLCVHPDYQGRGYGRNLLNKCEREIFSQGYDKIILGRNSSDFVWGALINSSSHHFFERYGYTASNGCLNMFLYTDDFSYETFSEKYHQPEDLKLIVSRGADNDKIISAVKKVEPKWAGFFYPQKNKDILLAVLKDEIAGFMTLDYNADTIITDEESKTGLLGYVGVVPEKRNRGIGRSMVAYGTELLKRSGCTEAFISYTSLDTWYSAIGYEEYLWFWMGGKNMTRKSEWGDNDGYQV